MNVDFIVVGRGLAGSTLSLKLVDAGYSIVSIDDPALSSCSKVSAGMINPLVFFRLTLAWRANEAIAVARDFYTSVEERSGMSFFHQTGMGRVFGSQHEADTWKKLCHDANFQNRRAFGYTDVSEGGNKPTKSEGHLTGRKIQCRGAAFFSGWG